MTRKQEINAIYDQLCWMLKGACECNAHPDELWEHAGPNGLRSLINAANDIWNITDSGDHRLTSTCYIDNWNDLEKVAELIYEGGGRINKPMDAKKTK